MKKYISILLLSVCYSAVINVPADDAWEPDWEWPSYNGLARDTDSFGACCYGRGHCIERDRTPLGITEEELLDFETNIAPGGCCDWSGALDANNQGTCEVIDCDSMGHYMCTQPTIKGNPQWGNDKACDPEPARCDEHAGVDGCNCSADCVGECFIEQPVEDCNGDWGGDAVVDECDVCGGDGIIDGACDCAGNVEDCAGVCGGTTVLDECEVCNGNGTEENYDCSGNCTAVVDCTGACGGIHLPTFPCENGNLACNYASCFSQDLDIEFSLLNTGQLTLSSWQNVPSLWELIIENTDAGKIDYYLKFIFKKNNEDIVEGHTNPLSIESNESIAYDNSDPLFDQSNLSYYNEANPEFLSNIINNLGYLPPGNYNLDLFAVNSETEDIISSDGEEIVHTLGDQFSILHPNDGQVFPGGGDFYFQWDTPGFRAGVNVEFRLIISAIIPEDADSPEDAIELGSNSVFYFDSDWSQLPSGINWPYIETGYSNALNFWYSHLIVQTDMEPFQCGFDYAWRMDAREVIDGFETVSGNQGIWGWPDWEKSVVRKFTWGENPVEDECGVCGGGGVDADDDGVCDDVDDCVVENGKSQECGCNIGISEGSCDCDGNGPADGFDCDGELSIDENIIPDKYSIHSIYPNPFNPVTSITYGLPEHVNVQILVYDLSGQQVETLINELQTPGYHSVNWNASSYPSGVYLIRVDSGEFTQTQKVVLIK